MPIWPFRRRRRGTQVNHDSDAAQASLLSEKARSFPSTQPSATTSAPSPVAHTPPIPTRSLRGHSERKRPASQQDQATPEQAVQPSKRRSHVDSANKENLLPPSSHGQYSSREDITALPSQYRLEHSPHLRPVDLERPPIPYNFRPRSVSQTVSSQRHEGTTKPARPRTLQSKRSTTDYGSPARILSRTSSKTSRKRDDQLREEEIRAMSAPIPIPKRRGDDPLRRDSKKIRGLGGRDSQVTLPPEGSVHSAMSGVVEQRGWEIGGFAVFSPRPAVRLSGTPQYVPASMPNRASGYLYRIDSLPKEKEKGKEMDNEKTPTSRDRDRKRRTVGNEADDLDASDIRLIMERDAKRRELRQKERQEKLERKLRSREGRNQGDSDARAARREEERRTQEEGRSRVEDEIQAHGPRPPPTAVHPALRNTAADEQPDPTPVGLGIGKQPPPAAPMESERQQQHALPTTEDLGTENTGTYRDYRPADAVPQNPFSDEAEFATPPFSTPMSEVPPAVLGASMPASPVEDTTAEDHNDEQPVLATAQAVRMSQANTPPLSPVYGVRGSGSASQLTEAVRQQSASALSTSVQSSDLPAPPPINVDRRSSDPPTDGPKRTDWGSIFKRGTFSRKKRPEALAPVETGFKNTSRESMRNQPIPAHLIDPNARRPSTLRSASGTPVRTQSKFREDLPDTPISPPDSRTQSPDVPTVAGAMAAREAGKNVPQPMDIPGRVDRNDTPVSQHVRGHAAMSGSLASIDSEGSWLASRSLKRQSNQSMLSRNISQRRAEFSASYEELGGDKDAEYLSRNRATHKASNPALMGASPDEESDDDVPPEIADDPLTVHGSVRRKPTLVQRDPRLKSREGLVTEFASAEQVESLAESLDATPDDDEFEPDSPGPQMERARSVNVGSRHSRQFSAGSAKLLDVRRTSMDLIRNSTTPEPRPTTP
ncbi:hypothetical protein CLAFUW4_12051 [Fulvia fulva]|nr:hypothetical protein CLAFUR4_12056 [Fulvia fulva]WPV18684.1 hypothetical protein CLAFUW4_12051 [Fulvia fulva]